MNCKDATPLIHAYLDHELDAANILTIEQHIECCSHCRQEYEQYRQLRERIKFDLQRHAAPAGLLVRIAGQLEQAPQEQKSSMRSKHSGKRLGVGVVIAASLMLGVYLVSLLNHHQAETRLLNEVLAEHVNAIHAEHLTDINNPEVGQLQPWFARKLDYSPRVYDFSQEGYQVLGGRLGILQNRHVASITYQHQDHIVNVYTWPSPNVDDAEQELHVQQGYHLLYWCQDKMNYWIVSDLNSGDLKKLAFLLQQKLQQQP